MSNQINALGDAKPAAPSRLLKDAPALSKIFELVDERDFAAEAVVVAEDLAKLAPRERARMAKELGALVKGADTNPTAAERKAYAAMFRTLAAGRTTSKTLATRLLDIRAAGGATAAPVGNALTLLDLAVTAALMDNKIDGVVSVGGGPGAKPFTDDELKKLADMFKRRTVEFPDSMGTLHLCGNALQQFGGGDKSIAAIRKVIASGKGSISVWASAHFTDNIIGQGGNHFPARHLSMSTTRFRAEGKGDLGVAIARSVTYVGNSAERDARLFSLSVAGPALAANQGLNIVIL